MRKGFNGLFGLVQNEMELNPLSGYLFVFISKDRNKVKILFGIKMGWCFITNALKKELSNAQPPMFTHQIVSLLRKRLT
ncbi:hypothetical protein CW751_05555 [Brumimicrobium salinarum]|uniref:Transposase n=1 Tax=Brumimicrobium salinarum TaxID=2058658 RepID=A0A2I0R3Y2_9FLAO|nr:hypothetical protein CW751_05555 [Brumimicrobium salinarum]